MRCCRYNITNLFIVSPTAWQKQYDAVPASVGDSAARSKQAWTAFAAHAVGSGPFKLEKLVPRQQLILDKKPRLLEQRSHSPGG